MKCPNCGATNPEGMKFCGNCGRPLSSVTMPAVEVSESRMRRCVECGRTISWDAAVCMYCGHDYRPRSKPGSEGHLMTGGILVLLAGILGIALLTVTLNWTDLSPQTEVLAVMSYACGIIGIIGGYMAIARIMFPLAVLGAALSIFTPAFFFGIPGLILVANSQVRFKDYQAKQAQMMPPARM